MKGNYPSIQNQYEGCISYTNQNIDSKQICGRKSLKRWPSHGERPKPCTGRSVSVGWPSAQASPHLPFPMSQHHPLKESDGPANQLSDQHGVTILPKSPSCHPLLNLQQAFQHTQHTTLLLECTQHHHLVPHRALPPSRHIEQTQDPMKGDYNSG